MQLTSTMKHHKHSICIYTYLNVFLSTTFIWHHLLLKASFLCICMCKQCVFLHCMLLGLFKILYCFFYFLNLCAHSFEKIYIRVCIYLLHSGFWTSWCLKTSLWQHSLLKASFFRGSPLHLAACDTIYTFCTFTLSCDTTYTFCT